MWASNLTAIRSGLLLSEQHRVRSPMSSTSAPLRIAFSQRRACKKPTRLSPGRHGCRAQADGASLYDRLGGGEPVKAVTSLLFDKLIEDPDLGHYFERSTMDFHKRIVTVCASTTLIRAAERVQSQFLAAAFGGPKEYKGRNMVDAHIGLPGFQHPKYFNIVATCLQDCLNELNVPKDLGDEVMSVAASLEPEFARVAKVREMIDGGSA